MLRQGRTKCFLGAYVARGRDVPSTCLLDPVMPETHTLDFPIVTAGFWPLASQRALIHSHPPSFQETLAEPPQSASTGSEHKPNNK